MSEDWPRPGSFPGMDAFSNGLSLPLLVLSPLFSVNKAHHLAEISQRWWPPFHQAYHVSPFATKSRNSQLKAKRTGDTVALHRSEATAPLNHLAGACTAHSRLNLHFTGNRKSGVRDVQGPRGPSGELVQCALKQQRARGSRDRRA